MSISAKQCRDARELMKWSIETLHEQSDASREAIRGFEAEQRTLNSDTLRALTSTFERAGIEFVGDSAILYTGRGLRGITSHPRDQGRGDEIE